VGGKISARQSCNRVNQITALKLGFFARGQDHCERARGRRPSAPGGANAGTCVNRQDGTDTVQACDNASYILTDRHGRRRVYARPNAGFERYHPGPGERPVFERRDEGK
jgi:hypothetical protein